MENLTKGSALVKRYDRLKSQRSVWDGHWQQVAEYIVPQKDDVYGHPVAGEEKYNKLYDSTAIIANEQLASALHGMLTNPASAWFGFTTGDPEMDDDDEVREHLQKRADIMIRELNQTNFQSEIHEVYVDLGSFGTACLRIEEGKDDTKGKMVFTAQPIYSVVVDESYDGRINTIGYEYDMSIENIVEQFGEDFLTYELRQALQEDPMRKFTIIHIVMPRKKAEREGMKGTKGYPFASYHILYTEKIVLKESGFKEFPYTVPRWTKLSGEKYGRSAGMKALPDIRMINKMKKAMIESAQIDIAPPVQVPDDGVLLPIKLEPASVNYYRSGTKDRIEPIKLGANYSISDKMIEDTKKAIERAFFIDQLQTQHNDRMTATEVTQRRDEQLRMLGPILGRLHNELLQPLIERVHAILDRQGVFPPLPDVLRGRRIQIKYKSLIAKAQRSAEAEAFQRAFALFGPMLEMKPDMLDNVDTDGLVREAFDIYGVSYKAITNKNKVGAIRKQRAQVQQQQQQLAMQQQSAEVQATKAKAQQ